MIIPVRCYTCGKLLSNKEKTYKDIVNRKKIALKKDINSESILNINDKDIKKTPEGEAMDELGLIRYCCRKIMMTNVELINEI
jgi:DNA-directed RNA polymerases I, II, and III subunit RPABC5